MYNNKPCTRTRPTSNPYSLLLAQKSISRVQSVSMGRFYWKLAHKKRRVDGTRLQKRRRRRPSKCEWHCVTHGTHSEDLWKRRAHYQGGQVQGSLSRKWNRKALKGVRITTDDVCVNRDWKLVEGIIDKSVDIWWNVFERSGVEYLPNGMNNACVLNAMWLRHGLNSN